MMPQQAGHPEMGRLPSDLSVFRKQISNSYDCCEWDFHGSLAVLCGAAKPLVQTHLAGRGLNRVLAFQNSLLLLQYLWFLG